MVAEVGNGAAAISAATVTGADVVLMDIYMPGVSGAEAACTIARRSPDTAVVMLSVFAEEAELADALAGGASGYVLKDRPVAEIVAAVQAAASGKPGIAPACAAARSRRCGRFPPSPWSGDPAVAGYPPATAGRIVTSSPSATGVARPSRKRMSSPLR